MAGIPSFWLLVFIAALGPISMNGVLPANLAVMEDLSVSYGQAQLVLTVFLISMLLFQLVSGSLSDRFGRRAVMIGGLTLYCVGGLACSTAQSIEWLLLGRFIQGAGGAVCISMPRAMVRDSLPLDQAASAIGYLTTAMMIAPLVAPALGGWLTETMGWRWMYGWITAAGFLILLVAIFKLAETHSKSAREQAAYSFNHAFKALMSDRKFLAPMLVLGGSAGVYYAFLAGAPYVTINLYGYSPSEYGIWFACTGIGYMAGNFTAGRWAVRLGAERMVKLGMIPLFISIFLLWVLSPWPLAFALFIPAFAFAFSNGICIPGLTSICLGIKPEFAGTASGLLGVAQLGIGVMLGTILGAMLDESATPLFVMMTLSLLITIAGLLIWQPVKRNRDSSIQSTTR
uniref:Bcr/CflA family efflux transporter n=1 Tax=uncultured Thiotrichaceae bacterium TaxID=298394 RepID=A0A6S6UDY7_9GAMM|nr:MAG: Bcr/CflA family efflux transporter [uncultured Thiotrichaceae bacterium]